MRLTEILRPSLEKLIIFLILFTFLPWPNISALSCQSLPNFGICGIPFPFYGPASVVGLSSTLLTWLGDYPHTLDGSFAAMFIIFLVACYLIAGIIAVKTKLLKPTKTKSISSFALLLITFVGLIILLQPNDKGVTLIGIISLAIFSIFYMVYSLIEKKK